MRVGVSLSVFNGLLYGGDMAPDVKQGAADRITVSVADYAKAVQVSDRFETRDAWDEMLRIYTCVAPSLVNEVEARERWYDRFIAEQGAYVDQLIEQRRELRQVVRKWEINFLLVCSQFAVVAVAAVWGWAR